MRWGVVADLVLIALGIALQRAGPPPGHPIDRGADHQACAGYRVDRVRRGAMTAEEPRAASTRLAALRNWLDTHGNEVIIIVCLVLGVWLTGQSIRLLAIGGR